MALPQDPGPIVIARIGRPHGVNGWFNLNVYCRCAEDLLKYRRWLVETPNGWTEREVENSRTHGRSVIARLKGVDDRSGAEHFLHARVAVEPAWLDKLPPGEYYWYQLTGLDVVTCNGDKLGTVSHLFETGANDVLVVKGERERLLPYTPETVKGVDIDRNQMTVEWDPEF